MLPCYGISLCPQCFARALPTPRDETASLQTDLKWLKCSKFRRVYFASTFQASKEDLCWRYIPHYARRPLNFKNWSGKIWSHLPEWICFSKWMAYGRCLSWKQLSRSKTAVIQRPNPFKTANLLFIFGSLSLPSCENCRKKKILYALNQCRQGACAAKQEKQQTQTPSHLERHLRTARTARTFLAGPTFEPQNPRNNISHIGVA